MLSILYALKHCIEDDIAKVNNTVARGWYGWVITKAMIDKNSIDEQHRKAKQKHDLQDCESHMWNVKETLWKFKNYFLCIAANL